MQFRGHVEKGMVVVDEPVPFADGTPVHILAVPPSAAQQDWQPLIEAAGQNLVDPNAYKELRAFDQQHNVLAKP